MEAISIPEGSFWMGCDQDVDPGCPMDETPGHDVSLSSFTIDRYEATIASWSACEAAGACGPRSVDAVSDVEPSHPATGMDLAGAGAYCAWREMRLPTEAEWEKAARGTDARLYPWGDAEPTCDLAWSPDCGPDLAPVGAHPDGASPYGIEDVAGNAWEWVSDAYQFNYYEVAPREDPPGPASGPTAVLRSASQYSLPRPLRASERNEITPTLACPVCGVRCVGDSP